MIASLSVVLGVVHLPLDSAPPLVGWHRSAHSESITLGDLPAQETSDAWAPVTRFGRQEAIDGEEPDRREDEPAMPGRTVNDRLARIPGLEVMSAAPQMPEIVGGIGAYYVHIEYPRKAVRERIEGRLMLSFIVDTEGRTDDVRVVESLHPVCDSAAVAALRKTRFVPGRREGEPVAVRMHLPVRFRLVSQ